MQGRVGPGGERGSEPRLDGLQSPPKLQLPKRARRASLKKNGNWGDLQLREAMAVVDEGCPVQIVAGSLFYHQLRERN
jgi:hypothetical protein